MEMLNKIEEPVDYINAVLKLLPYCLPKVKPIDTKIQDIEPVVLIYRLIGISSILDIIS